MNKKSLLNEKEAEVGINLQQPQDLINKAAQPERLVEGNGSSEAAALQEKRQMAAEKFVGLVRTFWGYLYEPYVRNLPKLIKEDVAADEVFGPHIYCTPDAVLIKLGNEWLRLTTEDVAEAFKNVYPPYYKGATATKYADEYLTKARMVCKKRGQVGWVLPRINKKGGALV